MLTASFVKNDSPFFWYNGGMLDKLGGIGSKGAAAAKLVMLQRRISKKKIVHEEGDVKVIVSGDGKVKRIEVAGEEMKELSKVVNQAIERAQKWAASEMQGMMGDLGKMFR